MTFRPGPTPPAPPRHGNAAAAAPLTDGEWHRLHPLTPLLRGGIFLIVVLGIVLNNLRDTLVEMVIPGGGPQEDGDPVRYVYEHGAVGWVLLGIVGFLVVLIGLFYLSWRMHEFRVTGEIVEVRSGVLFRNHRKARLDRIQGINISRPLIPRLFGTAKLEIAQAGNDANVQLAYLGAKAGDDLRQRILVLASGAQDDESGPDHPASNGLVQDRVSEFLSPELDPASVHATRIVRVRPGRLIASTLLSGTTVFILLLVVAIIVSIAVTGEYFLLVSLFPAVIGAGGYYVRKFSKSLQYTIADTRDGIRIGFGLVSTTNETLPPGRIHAVSVAQPLLWRPFGWWDIRINRATNAGNGASNNQQVSSIVLPVGTAEDVRQVLEIILPTLVGSAVVGPGASKDRMREGSAEAVDVVDDSLTTTGDQGGFRHSPRRGRWLRPLSARRNGYRFVQGAVLLRLGAVWRTLVVVPLPRVQSVKVSQGPVERLLRLASVHVQTVSGPVTATVGAIDARDAQQLWAETAERALEAAATDTSHRWRSASAPAGGQEARGAAAAPAAGPQVAGPERHGPPDRAPAPAGWGDVPPTGAVR
ncbi:PH domain-containing protein [Curtobacterium sp. MCLR17_007]|uniref:PH domain-containing protein n=1 Tax=unclassified Curtobacterium TaxID=257496 RepID=UPI0006F77292|nr:MULTISPECIES: PH domain-containing protein [unclassified Curtobacterium]KQS06152.1 hypothetical protein ASG04_16475 [Curtobacterium sp. Leaf183]WIB60392.1 PH domain-containing protein [Curtobacterium sp. MCLR17_007]